MPEMVTIQMPLRSHDDLASRPVQAEHLGGDTFRVMGPQPKGESWIYPPGAVVYAIDQDVSDGEIALVAVGLFDDGSPAPVQPTSFSRLRLASILTGLVLIVGGLTVANAPLRSACHLWGLGMLWWGSPFRGRSEDWIGFPNSKSGWAQLVGTCLGAAGLLLLLGILGLARTDYAAWRDILAVPTLLCLGLFVAGALLLSGASIFRASSGRPANPERSPR